MWLKLWRVSILKALQFFPNFAMLVILDLLIGLKGVITQKMDSEDTEKDRTVNFLMSYNDRFLNDWVVSEQNQHQL